MSALFSEEQEARLVIEAVILRAVPCSSHVEYVPGCPLCLTGEQAAALGVDQDVVDCGVLSSEVIEPGSSVLDTVRGKFSRAYNRARGG